VQRGELEGEEILPVVEGYRVRRQDRLLQRGIPADIATGSLKSWKSVMSTGGTKRCPAPLPDRRR
jgi:hypothetical protein